MYNAGNQKSQIDRLLLEEIYCRRRRRRRRFPYIYRNTRSGVLVRTRPRLFEARAVKAVHPRIPRTIGETTVLPLRVSLSNCWSSSQINPLDPDSFKNSRREFLSCYSHSWSPPWISSKFLALLICLRFKFQKLNFLTFMYADFLSFKEYLELC